MTSDHTSNPARPTAAAGPRYSLGVLIAAGLAGLAIGALAVFAVAGVTWKVRVELPPPPYPQVSSAPPAGYPSPPPPAVTIEPTSGPSVVPPPPFPPGPR
jgi:hypothetical protein